MIAASDHRNPCPQSCWLSSSHFALLATHKPAWFRCGIFVAKLHTASSYLHSQPDGTVCETSALPAASTAYVLGLLTRKSFHFVLASPCHHSGSKRILSASAASCLSAPHSAFNLGCHVTRGTHSDAVPGHSGVWARARQRVDITQLSSTIDV